MVKDKVNVTLYLTVVIVFLPVVTKSRNCGFVSQYDFIYYLFSHKNLFLSFTLYLRKGATFILEEKSLDYFLLSGSEMFRIGSKAGFPLNWLVKNQ